MISLTFSVWSVALVIGALFSMYITSPESASNSELEYPEVNDEPFTVELNPVSGVPVALEVCPVTTFAPEKAV